MGTWKQWVTNTVLLALLCSLAVAQQTASPGAMPLESIIQSMQKAHAAAHPQASYQIIREYRLFGAKDSKADSEVVAEINFRPPASKDYRIQRSSGSSRGQELVSRVLDREVATSKGNKASSAISTDNYTFNYISEATLEGRACYVLGLKPKRKDKDLISGQVWIDKHSFLIRQIQGEVEKRLPGG